MDPNENPSPVVGDWYRRPDGPIFEVVALDEEDDSIEVQHIDGTLEEFDYDSWSEQLLERTEAPKDWTGSVEVTPEDLDGLGSEPGSGVGEPPADPLDYLDRGEVS